MGISSGFLRIPVVKNRCFVFKNGFSMGIYISKTDMPERLAILLRHDLDGSLHGFAYVIIWNNAGFRLLRPSARLGQ